MIRGRALCTVALSLVLLPGCNRVADRSPAVDHPLSEAAFVAFELQPLRSDDKSRQWIGSYSSSGKVARFRIDCGPAEATPGNASAKSGEGTLLPESGSDSSVLLMELQKALKARSAPQVPVAKTSVPFTYVNLWDHLSQTSTGEFSANPPGDWTALKLIFGEGERESQILLYLNDSTRKGQFSMKEPRYGDLALAELAKVL